MDATGPGRAYNAVSDFVDANVERGLADKIAFTDPHRTLSYRELQAATCRFGRALRTVGLRQASRTFLVLLDTVECPIALWRAIPARVLPVRLTPRLTPVQYA